MKKKLRSSQGMTLTELLVALMIVALIGVALTTGVNSAVNVYRDSTRLYEAETLCGTILTSLEDEFRFGRDIRKDGETVRFDSQIFGNDVEVLVDDEGKITIGQEGSSFQLLNDKAYTSGLKVLESKIDYSGGQVTVTIAVGSGTADPCVEHEVKVAPLEN